MCFNVLPFHTAAHPLRFISGSQIWLEMENTVNDRMSRELVHSGSLPGTFVSPSSRQSARLCSFLCVPFHTLVIFDFFTFSIFISTCVLFLSPSQTLFTFLPCFILVSCKAGCTSGLKSCMNKVHCYSYHYYY